MSALSIAETEIVINERTLAGLGADHLARLLLDAVARDPALIDRLRPALRKAGDPPRIQVPPSLLGPSEMLGHSPAMRRLRETLRKVAATDAPVLVTGESGTGKELAAANIHRCSGRASGPFVAINCAALPPSLIASELFGHERGAFTGADQRRIGHIEAAEGGTLFLDEIGDLPLDLQAHLLRFLQEKTIDRLGGRRSIKVDVRIVAATNMSLRQAVSAGRFREDLFYRLNVLTVEMPPLRERGADVETICEAFLEKLARENDRPVRPLSAEARAALSAHSWPGNVRELIATLRRAVIMADGAEIEVADLGLPFQIRHAPGAGSPMPARADVGAARREAEAEAVRRALVTHGENVTRAAESLGVSRVTLYRMMERLGIALKRTASGGGMRSGSTLAAQRQVVL